MLEFSLGEVAWLAVWIIAAGIATGLLAGLFGIGGGAVIVPVLYEVFRLLGVPEDVRMQLCVGTSLAIIVPTTVRSYVEHKAKGAVIPHVLRSWAAPAVCGVVVGAIAAAYAPAFVFKLAFMIFALLISTKMLFAREHWNLGTELPGHGVMAGYGFLNGLWSSLIGVSGGSISNLVLTLYGQPIHRAVATSSGIGVPITVAGTLGYIAAGWRHMDALPPLSAGFVSLIGFALMAPVSSLVSPFGARLAHWLPTRQLETAFGIFLLLVALRFAVSLF